MKDIIVVILAGGKGTRLKEKTKIIPKPMVKVFNKPILVHIINHYKKYGIKKFIIATGFKSKVIEEYFKNKKDISVIYTGLNTLTGGRLKRLEKYINNTFFLTYGDGICDININSLYKFHKKHKKIATITGVHPVARFGEIILNKNGVVKNFNEKPQVKNDWINGGFFVFEKNIFKYLRNDKEVLEKYPLQKLTRMKELIAFRYEGFWHCMDTIRDIEIVNKILRHKWLKKRS